MLQEPPVRVRLSVCVGMPETVVGKGCGISEHESATGSDTASARIIGDREISGQVTSGNFCDIPGTYTLYFDARFDRPFRSFATWRGTHVATGARAGTGAHSGAAVTFDTTRNRVVGCAMSSPPTCARSPATWRSYRSRSSKHVVPDN